MSVNETVGNAAKMREALVNISQYAECADMRQHDAQTQEYIGQIRKWANDALKEPARNCDVGTARQQEARFVEACRPSLDCYVCKLGQGDCDCRFYWAQMTYEEGGAK